MAISLRLSDSYGLTVENFKARLYELAALAPASLDELESDNRSVEHELRLIMLCASLRSDIPVVRAAAEYRMAKRLSAPEPLDGR